MARLNIGYDLLTWEGDILRLHFWTHAFEFLKSTGAVFLQTEGKLKGCWVMRIEDEAAAAGGGGGGGGSERGRGRGRAAREGHRPIRRHRDLRRQGHGLPAVEVRPARTRLPLPAVRLGARHGAVVDDVRSRPRPDAAPAFGRASWVCNVIDTRQSYLQKLVKQALAALGYHEQAAHSVHYSYEMVALSHATARELGYDTSDRRRPAVRRGVRPQGTRRQGRRPHRPADRQGQPGGRQAQRRPARRQTRAASRRRSPSPRSATSW